MERITSARNPVVQALRGLKEKKNRQASGCMLIEGEKLILEALNAGLALRSVLISDEVLTQNARLAEKLISYGAAVYAAPETIINSVCDTKTPQGICAACAIPAPMNLVEPPERIIALDGVQDPGNVGTIWRTADASGFGGLMLSEACADPFSPKVQRAAMGSGFRLPVSYEASLEKALGALKDNGYTIIAADTRSSSIYEYSPISRRIALVIGSEAHGISRDVMALADHALSLPLRGKAESLNAAIAAGIMMYELVRALEKEV